MGMHQTNQFDSDTQKQVPHEQFNFSFDLWAKAVRQQMLEALQTRSALIELDEIESDGVDEDEDLSDALDDESE
ncbi:MAG: hypothetical protein WBA77_07010 [Microcoleaceae cyanobacterium]